MMLTSAWTQLRFHQQQHDLWYCPKRFAVVPAGRGSGKTELARRRLVRFLPIQKPWDDPRYFFAGPTLKHARELAWEQLIGLIPSHWIGEISPTRQTIFARFPTHVSRIVLVGLNDKRRSDIEGFQWDGGIVDESSDVGPGLFGRLIVPALAHRDGWCWRIGVPKRQGIGAQEFREFYEEALTGENPDSAGFSWPSRDILPPDVIEMMRRALDQKDFLEQCEATWQSAGGGVFYAFDSKYNVRPVTYYSRRPIVLTCDFNVDPMAWVLGHRYPERIEWFDELWLRDTNTAAALDVLRQRYQDHEGGWEIYGDATGGARKTSAAMSDYATMRNAEWLKQAGRTFHIAASNPEVADRFAACNALFLNAAGDRRMFVAPNCKQLIRDIGARYYKPGTREPGDPPGGEIGHMTDAMGYAVHYLFPIRVELETKAGAVIINQGVRR